MSTRTRMTAAEFDAMVERGAFEPPQKIELIDGQLCVREPAGPIHDDYIEYLIRWSCDQTSATQFAIRSQAGLNCGENRPEPDLMWLRPRRYGRTRPSVADAALVIEVADSSLTNDLRQKADMYAREGVAEYWVIDIPKRRVHVMTGGDGQLYRSITVVVPPTPIAPRCLASASLDTGDLFSVS